MATVGIRRHVRLLTVLLSVFALLTGGAASAAVLTGGAANTARHAPAAARAMASAKIHPAVRPITARRLTATTHSRDSIVDRTVRIHPGDTLWAFARRYQTTVAALQQANHLGSSTLIYAGRQLVIHTVHAHAVGNRQPDSTAPSDGAAAVSFARHQLGIPYHWGGSGASGYDCSGLVQAAWRSAGVSLPRTSTAQAHAGTRITRSELHPGDLVFTHGYEHVQLYAGNGRVIEAAHPGTRVRYAPLPVAATVTAYVRVGHAPRSTTLPATYRPATPAPARHIRVTGSPSQIATQIFGDQYACAAKIIAHESSWNVTAVNPSSGAYGLGQALPASKMSPYGTDWRTDPVTQLRWMHAYVTARYGNACAAWAFWQTHHWY